MTSACALAFVLAFTALAQEPAPPVLGILLQQLSKTEDAGTQLNLLRGINAALKGRRGVTPPAEWPDVSAKLTASENSEIREIVQSLGAVFGSTSAFGEMRKLLSDPAADKVAREKALESLLSGKDAETLPVLQKLAKEPGPLRRAALRGLATFDHPETPALVLGIYPTLAGDEKRDALATLLARAASGRALVAALEAKQIPTSDLSPAQIRQLRGMRDAVINEWLKRNPALAISASDKQAEIARYKTFLTPETVKAGDVNHGRALFAQTCATCHRLFDAGTEIGPELTGANRADIDYLLQNILDPNGLIGADYQSVTAELKDGRVVVGMVRAEDANAFTFKTLTEQVLVPREDIKTFNVSEVSMMPEGLLAAFTPEQVRDLFAYLGSTRQVPMLVTPTNAADFFNGNDLSRWRTSGDEWRVENGELIGRAAQGGAAALISEMIARDFRMTAQLKLTGENPAAELVVRGRSGEEGFRGASLSFGGGTPGNIWKYPGGKPQRIAANISFPGDQWTACEVVERGGKVRVSVGGKAAIELEDAPGGPRTQPAFYVQGAGVELRIKELKIEPLVK